VLYAYSALEAFGNHYVDLFEATTTVSVKRRAEDVSIAQPGIERLSVGQKLDLVVLLATGGRAGRVGRP